MYRNLKTHTHIKNGWLLRTTVVQHLSNHTVIDMVEIWKQTIQICGENYAGKGFSHAVSLFASSDRHRIWCYILKSYVYTMMLSQQTWKQGNSTRKPFVLSLIAEEIYRLISRGVWKWRTVQDALLKGIKGKNFLKRKDKEILVHCAIVFYNVVLLRKKWCDPSSQSANMVNLFCL